VKNSDVGAIQVLLMCSLEFFVYAEIKKHINFYDKKRREETTRRIHRSGWKTIL
jgi:hypothetical protein